MTINCELHINVSMMKLHCQTDGCFKMPKKRRQILDQGGWHGRKASAHGDCMSVVVW